MFIEKAKGIFRFKNDENDDERNAGKLPIRFSIAKIFNI